MSSCPGGLLILWTAEEWPESWGVFHQGTPHTCAAPECLAWGPSGSRGGRQSLAPTACQTAKLRKPGQRSRGFPTDHRAGIQPSFQLPQRPDKCFSLGSSQRPPGPCCSMGSILSPAQKHLPLPGQQLLSTPHLTLWDHTPSVLARASGEAGEAASSGDCFPHPSRNRKPTGCCHCV